MTQKSTQKQQQQNLDNAIKERLRTDPKFFIESCLFIIDKDSKKVPFSLNYVQNKYYNGMTNMDVILKARKQGFSSLILALGLHRCLFVENSRCVVVSNELLATKRLLDRLRYFLKTCIFPINTEKNSENEISFPDTNSSFYIGTAGSKTFGRGDDITFAHLSEFCFYENIEIVTSVREAGTNNMKIVLESTANGAGTPSHDIWLKSIKKEIDYKPNFFPWHENPDYRIKNVGIFDLTDEESKIRKLFNLDYEQIAWRREKVRSMPFNENFPQEYPACWEEAFLASGKMAFNYKSLYEQEQNKLPVKWDCDIVQKDTEILIVPQDFGMLKIWRSPKLGSAYLITADTAEGIKGGAYSVADVYEISTWEQVAQFRGHIKPNDFADKLYLLAVYYNYALLMCESNHPGNATLARLEQLDYPNLWLNLEDNKPWRTTSRTRALMISAARKCVNDLSIKINSETTINECRTFVLKKSGRIEASNGCFDDAVITLGMAANALMYFDLESEVVNKPEKNPLKLIHRLCKMKRYETERRYKSKQIV
jgi:hypothetical protein